MTNEIKRLLRCLDEACQEQGVSMADALAWFETSQPQQQQKTDAKQKATSEQEFKEIAENLLNSSCITKQAHKNICVEVLCMVYEARDQVLLTKTVLDRLFEKGLIPAINFGRQFVKEILYDFLYDYYKKQGVDDPRRIIGKPCNWHSICHDLRNLVKTL